MVNKIAIFLLSLIISSIVIADTVAVNPEHPDQYVVKKGDTLWDIAGKFLLEPWRWPDIWHANPQIANPHLIYPGDIVALQYKDGQPIITVSRSGQMASGRTVKLSPRIRSHENDQAIPAIPIDTIKQFLIRPLVVTKDEMDAWPYVVSNFEEHLIAGAGNKIYVRGIPEDNSNKRFAVYRRGEPFINPRKDEKEILGYEAIYLGEAIIEKEGDPASAIIAQSYREILEGDRLASESDDDISTNFVPSAPDSDVNGNIISVYDGVAEIGQYQVVVMDLGKNDGMNVGNVLGIFQSGKIVKDKIAAEKKAREECEEDKDFALTNSIHKNKCAFDRTDLVKYMGRPGAKPEEVELPEEYAGVVMIFRTFDKLSYGLVMESISNIHIYDSVRNL